MKMDMENLQVNLKREIDYEYPLKVGWIVPTCPNCNKEILTPEESEQWYFCECKALYFYDPWCDEFEDVNDALETHLNISFENILKGNHDIEIFVYHNYLKDIHAYNEYLDDRYDIFEKSIDGNLSHLVFLYKKGGNHVQEK